MRIALFGGTFDPIHLGHLLIAEAAREQFRLDRVVFLPSGRPPHRPAPAVSARHRLAMVRLAVRGNRGFRVNDWEIRQNRVVYTIETLEHFRRLRPHVQWHFIVGADERRSLPRWKESRRLQRLCRFIAMGRLDPYASTDIRRRLRRGLSIRYRVPDSVERYIRTHHLY